MNLPLMSSQISMARSSCFVLLRSAGFNSMIGKRIVELRLGGRLTTIKAMPFE